MNNLLLGIPIGLIFGGAFGIAMSELLNLDHKKSDILIIAAVIAFSLLGACTF